MKASYRTVFDKNLDNSLQVVLRLLKEYPKSATSLLRITAHEAKAKKNREKWLEQDVNVPPLVIVSTTEKCNLHCKGCYSVANCREDKTEMTAEQIDAFLSQASSAGCSAILLAGGEPLMSTNWINKMAEHPELVGLIFTNGTLINAQWVEFFNKHRNLIPLFSVEGTPLRTDDRRGEGVSKKINSAMNALQKRQIPFGISITTGQHNISEVTSEEFINPFINMGCRVVVHVEYVPVDESTELLALTDESKAYLQSYCDKMESKALFFAFPGDESIYDGCLAAGRGFVHVSSSGMLEPCPFAPYSDRNVCQMTFIEALKSPLLHNIREQKEMLHEGKGGCALRNKDLLSSFISS